MGRPTRRARHRFAVSCLVLCTVVVVATGCSDETAAPTVTPISSGSVPPEVTAAPMTAVGGSLKGFLTQAQQQRAVDEVAGVVDGWIEAAWVAGPWPRAMGEVWSGFTEGAVAKARSDAPLTSGAHYAERVSSVVPTRRDLKVDLLAQQGVAHAATVRVALNLDVVPIASSGGDEAAATQKVVLRGRLFLTREGEAWTVFGYDLARGGW